MIQVLIECAASHIPLAMAVEAELRKRGYRCIADWRRANGEWVWRFDIRRQARTAELRHGILVGHFLQRDKKSERK